MIYFISDLHLGIQERKLDKTREDLLLEFLRKIRGKCEVLYILGDLFDYWFEYKTVVPRYFYRTLAVFRDFTDHGIKIEYLMGNHDFGHVDFFREELGIEVYPDDIEREHNRKKFYLSHGDGKTYRDSGYRFLKKILRSPLSLWAYLKLHPDIGISLASSTSKSSRNYTEKKDYGNVEGMEDFARLKTKQGFDYVLMGHRHKHADIDFGSGRYINTGDWLSEPLYAVFDGEDVKLKKVKELV